MGLLNINVVVQANITEDALRRYLTWSGWKLLSLDTDRETRQVQSAWHKLDKYGERRYAYLTWSRLDEHNDRNINALLDIIARVDQVDKLWLTTQLSEFAKDNYKQL